MKSSAQTTYCLFERGVEDKGLLEEINKLFVVAGIRKGTKEAIKKYPYLCEFEFLLRNEVENG